MPEFRLPLGSTESHVWFDGLPEICRGYVEAAFFTGIQFYREDDSGGDNPEELTGLGPANLDAESRAGMEAQAARFWIENAEALAEACAHGGSDSAYDLEQAGRDFWFSRNGHGVGFWDRGLGEIGDRLHAACQHREIDLFPYPCDPETGEPFPGYHADHATGPAGDPDPENPDGWRVALASGVAPLTDAERAALEALETAETGGTVEPLPEVSGRYGAPMGRRSGTLQRGEPVTAARVTLDCGGYDSGGAYWGVREPGVSLFRVSGERSGATVYADGRSKADAINKATEAQ